MVEEAGPAQEDTADSTAGQQVAEASNNNGDKNATKVVKFFWKAKADVKQQAFHDHFMWPLKCLHSRKDKLFMWGQQGREFDTAVTSIQSEPGWELLTGTALLDTFKKIEKHMLTVVGSRLDGNPTTGHASQTLSEYDRLWVEVIQARASRQASLNMRSSSSP